MVEMKPVPSADESFDSQIARLDPTGAGSIPFANAGGRLLLKAAAKKVRLDSNGDGAIDDRDAPPAEAGETVPVRFLLGSRAAEYPVRIEAVENQYVVLGGCLVLEGAFEGCTIRLYDTEMDGTFGQAGKDTVRIVEPKKPGAKEEEAGEEEAEALPLGRVLCVKGRLYEAAVSDGGCRLALRPHAGETAQLTIRGGAGVRSWTLQLAHADNAQFACVAGAGPAVLVPGAYRIASSEVSLEPKREKKPRQKAAAREAEAEEDDDTLEISGSWDFAGREGPILEVRAGAQTVTVGPPFRLAFDASRVAGKAGKVVIEEPRLVGTAGEWYTPDTNAPPGQESALTSHVRAWGKEQKLSTLEFG
jgi:hypothetical protein